MRKGIAAALAILALLSAGARAEQPGIDHFILALSWQPAFCQYNPNLPECPSEKGGGEPTQRLTLHGLWPNGEKGAPLFYCNVEASLQAQDKRATWCALPAPKIGEEARALTDGAMPGSRSCLDRHQWLKHGTCAGMPAEAYFAIASRLALDVQRSKLAMLIEANLGGLAEPSRLRMAFAESFGADASRALSLRCRKDGGRAYLSAVWIRLKPDIAAIAPETANLQPGHFDTEEKFRDGSCPALIYIDPPGL